MPKLPSPTATLQAYQNDFGGVYTYLIYLDPDSAEPLAAKLFLPIPTSNLLDLAIDALNIQQAVVECQPNARKICRILEELRGIRDA